MRRAVVGLAAGLLLLAAPGLAQCPADQNGDGAVTVADAILLVRRILEGGATPTSTASPDPRTPTATVDLFDRDRFRDIGAGLIADRHLGVVWEKKGRAGGPRDVDQLFTHPEALAMAATLNAERFGGRRGWRLPSHAELFSLSALCYFPPTPIFQPFDLACSPGCTVSTCSCGADAHYWSATASAERPQEFLAYHYRCAASLDSFPPEARLRARAVAPLD